MSVINRVDHFFTVLQEVGSHIDTIIIPRELHLYIMAREEHPSQRDVSLISRATRVSSRDMKESLVRRRLKSVHEPTKSAIESFREALKDSESLRKHPFMIVQRLVLNFTWSSGSSEDP